ncbi:MAG TPA: nucleoside hydrolase [Gaiellaceae bacterium]|jgi:inosine-uridine nucleoside N-ribohydrolase
MKKLILDVDTGTDDAIAIMLAALDPGLELLAVTTVAGNASLAHTTENTLRVLDHIGHDVPVYQGAAAAMLPSTAVRDQSERSRKIHGDHLDLPAARLRAQALPAARFLVEAFGENSETVLVPTGPLTNIATALLLDPDLARRIPRVVLMGGSHSLANVTPSAEFNIWADPEAARIVLRSGIRDLTIVPLDATHQALISEDDCDKLAALETPAGTAAAQIIRTRIAGYELIQPQSTRRSAPVHDAVCVAHLIDPGVIGLRDAHVDVELDGELTRGRTVADLRPISGQPANAKWAYRADRDRFLDLLLGAFS